MSLDTAASRPVLDSSSSEEEPIELLDIASLGGGLKVTDDRKVHFSMKLADAVLSLEKTPGDRPLRNDHVDYLKNAMNRGTFLFEQVLLVTCYCLETKKEYRINGQHTCWARTFLGSGFPDPLIRKMTYEAKTLQDVRRLYASVDRGAARTKSNVLMSYLTGAKGFQEFGDKSVKLAAMGLAVWKWTNRTERQRYDGDAMAFLMQTEYADLTKTVLTIGDKVWRQNTGRFFARAPVAGAIYATCAKATKQAVEFWTGVFTGIDLKAGDPRLKLRGSLLTARLNERVHNNTKSVGQEEVYRWCINSWNAWRRGETLTVLRVSLSSPRPAAK